MNLKTIGAELWEFFKKNFAILLIGTLFLIFYFGGCGNRGGEGKNTSDTTTTTTQVQQPTIVMVPYQPNQAGNTIYVPLPGNAQPVIPASTIEELTKQVIALNAKFEQLAREYYAIRNYADSFQLKDTAGNRVGVVKLEQKVSENTLKETKPSYQLSFPHTVTTITNTIYPKVKNQVFVGISVESLLNQANINQVDLGVLLKNKKEDVFALSGTYNLPNKSPGVKVGFYKKLQFKLPRLL